MVHCSAVAVLISVCAVLCAAKSKVGGERQSSVPLPAHVLNGKVFPEGFNFGTSTSSYQVEGGWLDGGKGMSIWDSYSHTPGMIANGDKGDVANDMYHLYPEDIKLMASFGLKHYRFSIAWNRILPLGVAPVNPEAIAYYGDLIDQLLAHGIEPHVTIYHSETPLALTMYPKNPMPFLDHEHFPKWFADYADVLFSNFGDRVKHWFTFNEPFCTAVFGTYGDVDPYMIAHNAILAHAHTVALYRSTYQTQQAGTIGIVLNTAHFYPGDASKPEDVAAAQRGYDFWYGWFMEPFTRGAYPDSMQAIVGDRLPKFTEEEKQLVKGSLDFVALNYYFPYLATPANTKASDEPSFWKDMNVTSSFDPSWPLSETGWGIYGPGLRDLLLYTQDRYALPSYVTENGLAWQEDNSTIAVNDVQRQSYLHDHIQAVGDALVGGADVRGYFVWSFQDNLEWASGYQMHFGLVWIDRPSMKRVPKDSMRYYSEVIGAIQKQ